jgi:uncharacterized protein YcbX
MSLLVSALWRYPLKSFQGASHNSLALTARGFENDRRWMVVDERGRFVTQRQLPKMSRFKTSLLASELLIENLDTPGQTLTLPLMPAGFRFTASIWGDECEVVDMGDAAASWLREQFGKTLRLCYIPDGVVRQVDQNYAEPGDEVGLADGFPLLICTEASIAALSQAYGQDLDPRRFRANIIISGAQAFEEDRWRRLKINGVEIDLVKPCARCAIPTIDPDTGERERKVFELLKRQCGASGQVLFGQNAIHRSTGILKTGAVVEVMDVA